MKGQNFRGGKQNNFSASASGSHQSGSSSNGQRKNLTKYASGVINTNFGSTEASDAHDKLINLLASATGKTVVSTVSSGARYKGVLISLNIGFTGEDALSIVLFKPTLVSKALINEKINVDKTLPAKMVIESKDLIDIEVTQISSAEAPGIKETSPEAIGSITETSTETTIGTTITTHIETTTESPTETSTETIAETTTETTTEITTETTAETTAETTTETTTETTIPIGSLESQFKTDRDISSGYEFKERELQRWVPDANTPEVTLETSGTGAWDQFKVNEERFGVESSYDEHLYTTKINKGAKDYKDRLLRAEKLAKEIEGLTSTDKHVMEERGVVDDSGMDEEDKYSGVIKDTVSDPRGNQLMAAIRNASVSKDSIPTPVAVGKYSTPRQRAAHYHNDPAIISSSATRKVVSPKPMIEAPNLLVDAPKPLVEAPKPLVDAPKQVAASKPQPEAPKEQVPEVQGEAFRLNARSEFNALREFSANFKIPHKIPNDLLPILAKDKLKQDEILKKQQTSNGVNVHAPPSVKEPLKTASPVPSKAGVPAGPVGTAEPKKESIKFKLNPKAAAFTPSKPLQVSPVPANPTHNRSPSVSLPRLQRPYSGSLTGSNGKRHNQVTAVEFFGGADKVPTPESQKEKAKLFNSHFNFYAAAIRRQADKSTPVNFEKAYKTPPTWDSTTDETYDKMIARNSTSQVLISSPVPHFIASPIMPNGVPPMMAAAFMGVPAGKYPMSPQFQQPMAVQFHQPFHPSMMYPQFQGGIPPAQPHMMYVPPGVDPQVLPPAGFMMPGYMGSPSPMNGGTFQGMNSHSQGALNAAHPYGGRRQHQSRKGSNAIER